MVWSLSVSSDVIIKFLSLNCPTEVPVYLYKHFIESYRLKSTGIKRSVSQNIAICALIVIQERQPFYLGSTKITQGSVQTFASCQCSETAFKLLLTPPTTMVDEFQHIWHLAQYRHVCAWSCKVIWAISGVISTVIYPNSVTTLRLARVVSRIEFQ